MRIEPVDIQTIWDEVQPLLKAHWDEVGFDFGMDPKLEIYKQMQAAGAWFVVAAFYGDVLVGYSSAMISPHQFNPSVTVCASEALFLTKDLRSGSLGGRLIIETEKEAHKRGATRMMWHTRAGTDLYNLFARRGYEPWDVVMARSL